MAASIKADRVLAGEVRRLALNKIKVILERPAVEMSERDKELHDAILLSLSKSVLPRLQEVTGEDGEAVKITLVNYANNSGQISTESVPNTTTPSV